MANVIDGVNYNLSPVRDNIKRITFFGGTTAVNVLVPFLGTPDIFKKASPPKHFSSCTEQCNL